MKEIAVSKQGIVSAIVLVLLVAAGWYLIQLNPFQSIPTTPTPSVDDQQAASAIVTGAEAFFSIDHQVGKDSWLTQFCAAASDGGCQFAKLGAASMWKKYQEAQTVTTASVEPEKKVKHTDTEQVWLMRIQLSAPIPGSETTEDQAYALAVRTNSGWKFERFLMPEEIQALETPAPEGAHK